MGTKTIAAVIIDESTLLTLDEFCHTFQVEPPIVVEMVELEIISPLGKQQQDWQFDSLCLKRAKIAMRFQRDLEVNLAGVLLALDLLEQIEELENRIRLLE